MPHAEHDRPVEEVRPLETAAESRLADAALSKARRKIIPFLFVLYLVAYLDRINVGFASLQMNRELGLSEAVFGMGAGLFFLGYSIFEVPSNLILARVGARLWIARIMISWGIAAMAMIAVRGAASFFALRFILGLAEAGFFPGVILYLTFWFPAREQARAVALFMTATALAGVIAGPVSGALLELHGLAGLSGWQWLFILEGLPAVILGVLVLRILPDGPNEAVWLEVDERIALYSRLEREHGRSTQKRSHSLADAISNSTVWILSLVYFAIVFGLYGVTFWLPQIIQTFGNRSNFEIGVLSAIPFFGAAVAMVLVGRASDLSGERRWHLAVCAAIGAAGLLLAATTRTPILSLGALSIAAVGIWGTFGPFWAMPPEFLSGTAAAGAIALINSIGNLGGFGGPYVVGLVKQTTHSFAGGMLLMAASLVAAGLLALTLPVPVSETNAS
ncbi:MAG TPA: MFS transporter [Candidatus Acidoferrales bacterium]|jgi:ACS family tartrate transporter-like MFS transporter|nr:MFS transporter [Candidatus Acidoferrales bacterium]